MSWIDTLLKAGGSNPLFVAMVICALAGLVFSGLFLQESERSRHRETRVDRVRLPSSQVARRRAAEARILRRDATQSSIGAVNALARRMMPDMDKFRLRLYQTGRNITIDRYLVACIVVAVVTGVGIWWLLRWPIYIEALMGFILGLGLPYATVAYMAKRRMQRFTAVFPDSIDLIVRAVRAGQPISEAIKVVAEQSPQPVRREFQQIRDAVQVGVTLREAIDHAADRITLPEFRFFNIALSIQQETGGNLAETLENLSRMLRRRKQIKLKIKAVSAEARASAWIVGSMPFVMFFILLSLNRSYGITLITDPRGIIMLVIGVLMAAAGIGIMVKMANFDF
jgi:tight adherence protein B